jgi:hypothetical protein
MSVKKGTKRKSWNSRKKAQKAQKDWWGEAPE